MLLLSSYMMDWYVKSSWMFRLMFVLSFTMHFLYLKKVLHVVHFQYYSIWISMFACSWFKYQLRVIWFIYEAKIHIWCFSCHDVVIYAIISWHWIISYLRLNIHIMLSDAYREKWFSCMMLILFGCLNSFISCYTLH